MYYRRALRVDPPGLCLLPFSLEPMACPKATPGYLQVNGEGDASNFRQNATVTGGMSVSLVFGCVWALAAAIVALQPMQRQYVPGVALLLTVSVLLGWIAWDYGAWIFALGLGAFLSMFCNPLFYLWRRARGDQPEVPS